MSVEKNNEITVKVSGNSDKVVEILVNDGFEITDKFSLEDSYFIPKNIDVTKMSIREILEKAVIIRCVRKDKILIFKKKEIDEKGNILSQEKIECNILNVEDGKRFLEAIGYKKTMEIFENDLCYSKNGLNLALKDIKNGDNLIEVETINKEGFRTIDDLKEKIMALNIPIDTSNFFVKKAEVELKKILK